MNRKFGLKIVFALIPILLFCCMPNDNRPTSQTKLSGTFLFNGGPSGDTVQFRFLNDSIMYEKLNSNPEYMVRYRFQDSLLISRAEDPNSGYLIGGATGKIVFGTESFDLIFANAYSSSKGNSLNSLWASISGRDDSVEFKDSSLMVSYGFGKIDTSNIIIKDNTIFNSKDNSKILEYKIVSDTLFFMTRKKWTFTKI